LAPFRVKLANSTPSPLFSPRNSVLGVVVNPLLSVGAFR